MYLRDNIMTLQLCRDTINEGELAEVVTPAEPLPRGSADVKGRIPIEVYPQSGSKVSLIQIDILKEGYFLRSVIEPEIIRRLAGNLALQQRSADCGKTSEQQKTAWEVRQRESQLIFF